jgi:hypothetical protein
MPGVKAEAGDYGTTKKTKHIPMQQRENQEVNMFKRIKRYVLENAITPPLPSVTALATKIDAGIEAYENAAGLQFGGSGESSGGVNTRREQYQALRDYLKDLARVGRSLDRATHPGLAETFVLPRTGNYPLLLAAADAMVAKATPLETEFVAHGMPATFLADIAALVTAFSAGTDSKIDGHQTQVEATSALRNSAAAAMDAAIKLDAIIRAHFRDNPVKLDGWASARHVARPGESEGEEVTPPGSGGDSGSGSGSAIVTMTTGAGEGSLAA